MGNKNNRQGRGTSEEPRNWIGKDKNELKDIKTCTITKEIAVGLRQDAAQTEGGIAPNGDNSDAEMAEILNDVEELFGEPVFLTH